MRRHFDLRFLAVGLLTAAPGLWLRAQDAPVPDPGPPERGVARMSVMNGEVSVRRGDSGDWVAAALNAPLMVDDRVATGAGARAEAQFDSANMIRVGANAEIRLAQLENGHISVQVAHGTVTFRILRDTQAQVEVDTPAVSVRPLRVGAYRVYVQGDGEAEITVRLGNANIYTPRGTQELQAGETMLVRGNPSDPEFRIDPAIAHDEWDRWNEQRDRELLNSKSYNRVPHDIYGTEDLDRNGQWVDVPSYGEVWSPDVGPDWAPYQDGRWVWEDYYGWTFVSYDPWGWAPFHYGRWFYAAPYGWCWYPGYVGVHYWSPALVAFVGFGPGTGVGVGFGSIGWVPLAPFEPMYPWWGRGVYAGYRNPAYFNRGANVANVNITNVYRNARVTNAVGSVSAVDFQQGRFNRVTPVSGAQIREAGLVRGQLPVAPTSATLRYANRAVGHVPASADNMRFFSHARPAPVQRVSFAEQQRAMQTFSRQPAGGWRNVPSPAGRSEARSAASPGGWRPVNQPLRTAPSARGGGWDHFGEPRAFGARSGQTAPYSGASYRSYEPPRSGAPQSIRVAPPVVRERSAPRNQTSSAPRNESRAGGGGARSAGGGGSHGGGHH